MEGWFRRRAVVLRRLSGSLPGCGATGLLRCARNDEGEGEGVRVQGARPLGGSRAEPSPSFPLSRISRRRGFGGRGFLVFRWGRRGR
jgi:hypothetical protein